MTIIKVLIDDDILIQLGKQLQAEKEGFQLDCYYSIDEFLAVASKYPNNIPIYIDSNLGTDTPGEMDSKRIYQIGFENIYLLTGYSDISLKSYPWIKEIKSKTCLLDD